MQTLLRADPAYFYPLTLQWVGCSWMGLIHAGNPPVRSRPETLLPFRRNLTAFWMSNGVYFGLQGVPMATVPASRPDLAAHREALRLPIPEIVKQLVGLIGRKLTAYVGGVRDVRAVDRWMNGSELYGDAEQRLRFAFQLVRMFAEREDPTVIQSWLTGLNPELGDRVPLRLMRENDLETVAPEIMGAARAFLVGS
jgi:hypothetical protein